VTTQSEYSLAYERGQQARRNTKATRDQHPYRYQRGADLLIERWQEGWDDQDAANRGTQHGVD